MAERSDALGVRFTPTPLWMAWAVSSSVALHALAWFGLGTPGSLPLRGPERHKSFVEFTVAPPELEELPPPEPEPKEPEPAALPPKLAKKVQEPQETPEPSPSPAQAEEAPPPELSGLTLTSEIGSGFAMPSGNGLAREGALRVPASLGREPPRPEPVPSPRAPKGPRIVAVKDLSARPFPPARDGALERNYPRDARSRGLGGTATLRVRIDADGVVRSLSVHDERQPGFAEACQRTLRGSRWSAPRDRLGNAVATEIRYKCRFLVQP